MTDKQNDGRNAAFPNMETKRLILRRAQESDAADIFSFRSDPYVQRFNSRPLGDQSEVKDLLLKQRARYKREDGITWAVELKSEGKVIGLVGYSQWSTSNRAMAGYDFNRAYWGQGFASEAVKAIIRYGFEEMELNRIEAATIDANHESRRMLERLGFVLEGIRREYQLEEDGNYYGSCIYALLLSEYQPDS